MTSSPLSLIVGVDGGGTKTAARVAEVRPDGAIDALGEGYGGPSNVRAVGPVHAKTNLDVAINAAHEAAGTANFDVDYAVLALAGSALPDVQSDIHDWAGRRKLAAQVDIVHDAEPVLAMGAVDGTGVALIVGTGSVAIAADGAGGRAVIGGWGHWFGDQGSGFDIGRRALAAIAEAVDGIAAQTALAKDISERLQVDHPREIARRLSRSVDLRQEIAALASIVIDAAHGGDDIARRIVQGAAGATAALVRAAIARLELPNESALALAGGVACSGEFFRAQLLGRLESFGIRPHPVTIVTEPVQGSLMLGRDRLFAVARG
jgi:N-acetylglucosamine kinase-like BadF-type ATPase